MESFYVMSFIKPEQAERLRNDFKRTAHIHMAIQLRLKQTDNAKDPLLITLLLLATKQADDIFNDFEVMLTGNNRIGFIRRWLRNYRRATD